MSANPRYSLVHEDTEERNQLILKHLPQVQYIARRLHDRLPSHVQLSDLVQAGVLGLIDALERYDAERNVQFQSYANFRIRGAILDSLRELDWSPRDLRRKARLVQETTSRLEHELGRTVNEQEIADALAMPLADFQHLLGELKGLDLSGLQTESDSDGNNLTLEDVAASPEDGPYVNCLRSEMQSKVANAISELPEKEQQVLSLYYYEELTMKDIGTVLGVGESRVSQIHAMALVRLRGRLSTLRAGVAAVRKEAACKKS